MAEQAKRFRAFISYSKADKKTASRLHKALETYRVPNGIDVAGIDLKTRKLGRFFRDDDEMGAATSLGAALQGAIADAENLIVVCSPSVVMTADTNFGTIDSSPLIAELTIVSGSPHVGLRTRRGVPVFLRVHFRAGRQGDLGWRKDDPGWKPGAIDAYGGGVTVIDSIFDGGHGSAVWISEDNVFTMAELPKRLLMVGTTVRDAERGVMSNSGAQVVMLDDVVESYPFGAFKGVYIVATRNRFDANAYRNFIHFDLTTRGPFYDNEIINADRVPSGGVRALRHRDHRRQQRVPMAAR